MEWYLDHGHKVIALMNRRKPYMSKTGNVPQKRIRKPRSGTVEEKPLFLREGMDIEEEKTEVYDLVEAFTSHEEKRSTPIYISILGFSLIIMVLTILFTGGIQRDIDRVSVSIEEFKDLNLQEMLKALRAARGELGKIDEKISFMKHGMQMEIDNIMQKSALEIRRIEQSGLGRATKQRLIKKLRDEEQRKLRESRSAYEARISEKAREAEEIRKSMDRHKKIMMSERSDYDRMMKQKFSAYSKSADLKVYQANTMITVKDLEYKDRLKRQEDHYQALIKKYTGEMSELRKDLLLEAAKSSHADTILQRYRRALGCYEKLLGEHGFVIDVESKGQMLVDVNPCITLKKRGHAYVLNSNSKIVALVELRSSGQLVLARIIRRVRDDEIRPFDRILIKNN